MRFLLFALGSVNGSCLYLGSLNRGCKGWVGSRDDLYFGLPSKSSKDQVFVIWVPSWYCRYSHHLSKEEKCFLGWRGEGGELDLGLLEPRDGDWNHLPGVSGHWRDSESSSSGSGVPLGISKMTGSQSSHGIRKVEAASGGSNPTSMTESGRAVRGGVFEGPVFLRQPLCGSEIASLGGSIKRHIFVYCPIAVLPLSKMEKT